MKKKMIAILCITAMLLTGCSGNDTASAQTTDTESTTANTTTSDITEDVTEELILESLNNGIVIDEASGNVYKTERNANPISGSVFCADPTAVEYEGRLYVYGTNDHQQSELDTTNDYDRINSLVVFSTVISVFTFSEVSVNSVFSVVTPSVVSVVTVASCGISGTSSSFACS